MVDIRVSVDVSLLGGARQRVNVCDEAWQCMCGTEVPRWKGLSKDRWRKMTRKERLEAHLRRLAESLGGELVGYQVFND